jgi:Frag1/DRAM/Sfk1 family protein
MLPVVSGIMWLAMLMAMLLYWIYQTDRTIYPSMADNQTIAYISDVGAFELKPLFIAGCAVTAVFFDLSFLADRWLRHRGRLVPNTTRTEKILMALTIVFAIIGTVGLVCLAIFDTQRHQQLHRLFLLLFIVGYLISAIFVCWEYQRLGIRHREHSILAASFWVKLVFIMVEFCLAVAFAVTMLLRNSDPAAILEWVVAFVFSFYIFSFVIDLWPAIHTKPREMRFSKPGMSHSAGTPSSQEMEEGAAGRASIIPGQQYPRYMEQAPGRGYRGV